MPLPFPFDYKNPDYRMVFEWRLERLANIRANPDQIPILNAYYRDNPSQFIIDWGMTQDPRNPERGLPGNIPFLLFPRQEEFCDWVIQDCWRSRRRGVAAKCRDVGFSWLILAISNSICTFNRDVKIGYTSYKEDYVDKIGDPKSFFSRLRMFRALLPDEFNGGYNPKSDSPFKLMRYEQSGSVIAGEVGGDVGRGDRTAIYFVDESAKIQNDMGLEASLSNTTNCRIDVSTPRGMVNQFGQNFNKKNKLAKFAFRWRQDPRKDDDWYQKQVDENPPTVVAQEVDLDFSASITGRLFERAWIEAIIDANKKLGIEISGPRRGALDVADEGKDKNAFITGRGRLIESLHQWSGKGSDIYETVEHAFDICDDHGVKDFKYDADGMGAGVRGDARIINQDRGQFDQIQVSAFKGSLSGKSICRPDGRISKNSQVKNKDYFQNLKAQGWFSLRDTVRHTYRAITKPGYDYSPDDLIFLSPDLKDIDQLIIELEQVTYLQSKSGKMMIDKMPDGCLSPNLGDSLMIFNAPLPGVSGFYSG